MLSMMVWHSGGSLKINSYEDIESFKVATGIYCEKYLLLTLENCLNSHNYKYLDWTLSWFSSIIPHKARRLLTCDSHYSIAFSRLTLLYNLPTILDNILLCHNYSCKGGGWGMVRSQMDYNSCQTETRPDGITFLSSTHYVINGMHH